MSATMSTDTEPYELLTSTRYDLQLLGLEWNTVANDDTPSAYMLLPYHIDRLRDAAKQHGWTNCLDGLTEDALQEACDAAVEAASEEHPGKPFRVRVTLSRAGRLSATAFPVEPLPTSDPLEPSSVPEHVFRLDTEPTEPSLYTSTKTTRRGHYDAARARTNLPLLTTPAGRYSDVILHTPAGELSETSIRNLAIRRDGQWLTPNAKSSGCLSGVMRRLLLEQGKWIEAAEGQLRKDDLVDGEIVMTANGVEGCRLGTVVLHSR
ncbi:unnamed protein product [Somion occarium]|uniref:Aminodeoxychorismate lyase n=1 Tax=Somion occarium TaxID=3059160 RepID=A0ABP1CIN0_9APHY